MTRPIEELIAESERAWAAADRAFARLMSGQVKTSAAAVRLANAAEERDADVRFHPDYDVELHGKPLMNLDDFKGIQPFAEGHRIRRYVYVAPGGELVPKQSSMRGFWPGYEAKCSCGWETRTGGAIEPRINDEVDSHKWDVLNGFWEDER